MDGSGEENNVLGISSATGMKKGKSLTPNLDKVSVNLNKRAREGAIDPVIGRDKEIKKSNSNLISKNQKQSRFGRRTWCW